MTGYGKGVAQGEFGTITVELRAVNSKSIDVAMRLPTRYREQEIELRQKIAGQAERGKVECLVSLAVNASFERVRPQVNEAQFRAYYEALLRLGRELHIKPRKEDIFQRVAANPEVWISEETPASEQEIAALHSALSTALNELKRFRENEGEATALDLSQHLETIKAKLKRVASLQDERIANVKQRMDEALEPLLQEKGLQMDDTRLAQEMIFHIERLDVNEEMQRLEQHCKFFSETLDFERAPGRKLNFIAQEMGREINTLGSKANHAGMQHLVVEMKNALEKIKEQVLNVL